MTSNRAWAGIVQGRAPSLVGRTLVDLFGSTSSLHRQAITQLARGSAERIPEEVERVFGNYKEHIEALERFSNGAKDSTLEKDGYTRETARLEADEFKARLRRFQEVGETNDLEGDEAIKYGIRAEIEEAIEAVKAGAKDSDNKKKLYIGRLDDTAEKRRAKDGNAKRTLNTAKWSVPVNFAFMEAGDESGSTFKLATDLESEVIAKLAQDKPTEVEFLAWIKEKKPKTLTTEEEYNDGLSMLALELGWLIANGYTFTVKEKKAGGERLIATKP